MMLFPIPVLLEKRFMDVGDSNFLEQNLASLELLIEQPSKHFVLLKRVPPSPVVGAIVHDLLFHHGGETVYIGKKIDLSPIVLGARRLSSHYKGREVKAGTPLVASSQRVAFSGRMAWPLTSLKAHNIGLFLMLVGQRKLELA